MRSVGGGLRLFRAFGIDVYLHWTWAVVAFFFIQAMRSEFKEPMWAAASYLSLFAIVLIHEFGHSLACKSVGGTADMIMLWPLGGIAFVNPPLRPGAVLWSIAAGPLVNVILFPITWYLSAMFVDGDAGHFFYRLWWINTALLVFNVMPIYPLDGGQILHALLWFALGFARALLIVSVIGLLGAAGLLVMAVLDQEIFTVVISLFIASQAWRGFTMARELRRRANVTQPLEQQLRAVTEASAPVAPAEQVEPREPERPVDATTQRIVSETYEEALRRERGERGGRVAAASPQDDNQPLPR